MPPAVIFNVSLWFKAVIVTALNSKAAAVMIFILPPTVVFVVPLLKPTAPPNEFIPTN